MNNGSPNVPGRPYRHPTLKLFGPLVDCSGYHAFVVLLLAADCFECSGALFHVESGVAEVAGRICRIVHRVNEVRSKLIASANKEQEKEELPLHVDRTEERLSE
jgi:hypothetical protein